MDSLQGHFLIAAPKLSDPNFFHAVILMIQVLRASPDEDEPERPVG